MLSEAKKKTLSFWMKWRICPNQSTAFQQILRFAQDDKKNVVMLNEVKQKVMSFWMKWRICPNQSTAYSADPSLRSGWQKGGLRMTKKTLSCWTKWNICPKPKYCLFSRSFASLRMTKRRAQDDKKNIVMLNEVKHLLVYCISADPSLRSGWQKRGLRMTSLSLS